MAVAPSGSCIAVVKFLECKIRAGLVYPCGTYVWKDYSTFSVFEVKMTLAVYGSGIELHSVRVPYYDES